MHKKTGRPRYHCYFCYRRLLHRACACFLDAELHLHLWRHSCERCSRKTRRIVHRYGRLCLIEWHYSYPFHRNRRSCWARGWIGGVGTFSCDANGGLTLRQTQQWKTSTWELTLLREPMREFRTADDLSGHSVRTIYFLGEFLLILRETTGNHTGTNAFCCCAATSRQRTAVIVQWPPDRQLPAVKQ